MQDNHAARMSRMLCDLKQANPQLPIKPCDVDQEQGAP